MVSVPLATDKMIAEIDGAVGWVIFNNPARRNAVSVDMWRAIPAIFDRLEAEPAVRVIVLRGAGEAAFVSRLDISQFEDEFSSSGQQMLDKRVALSVEPAACGRLESHSWT